MSTGNEISKGVSATDYEQQVKRLKRNLFDCQEAAKDLAQQATKAEAERDALAAKLKEVDGRIDDLLATCHRLALELECLLLDTKDSAPVSRWWDSGMAALDGWHKAKDAASARPVPAEPVNVEFGMRGENMFFKIGNQSFLLDYKPAEPGEFEFMQKMLLSAFSSITPCVKTASEPVNARLLDVAVWPAGYCRDPNGKMSIPAGKEEDFNFGYDVGFQEAWEILNSAISAAGKSPTSQQERLLQDMHDAGREVDRVMAEPAPEAVRLTDYSSTVDRAWARFCGAFGDGPDAPYPGMIAAFETHYGQSFRDKEWRTEAACWAAAWHKATEQAAKTQPQPSGD